MKKFLMSIPVVVSFIILGVVLVFTYNIFPETLIGYEGLCQLKHYLTLYMILYITATILLAFSISFFIHGKEMFKRDSRKFRLPLIWGGNLLLTLFLLCVLPVHHRLESMALINNYRGPEIIQSISMLSDVKKDIEQRETYTIRESGLDTDIESFVYKYRSKRGRRRTRRTFNHVLSASGNTIAQISMGDSLNMKDKFIENEIHEILLYRNTGLIYAIDGSDREWNDYAELVELRYENGILKWKKTDKLTADDNSLLITIEMNGHIWMQLRGLDNRDGFNCNLTKNMKAYIALWDNGEYVTVSNVIEGEK